MPITIQAPAQSRVRVSLDGVDALGVKTGTIPETTAVLDNNDLATIEPHPSLAGQWIVTQLPQDDPVDAPLSVIVTIANVASGQYDTVTIEYGAGSQNSVAADAAVET